MKRSTFNHEGRGAFNVIGTRPVRHDGEEKVTGVARYGGDTQMSGLLHGWVLRSPHAHARIRSVDASAALAMEGVHAVITGGDLPKLEDRLVESGEGVENMRYMTDRVLAGEKALFKGHAVAAVAADDPWIAEEATKAIRVDYEVLRAHVDVEEAMADDAELLHGEITTIIMGQKQRKSTNICHHTLHERGTIAEGFASADVVVERSFKTKTVHQGYIELQNATAMSRSDGQVTVWTSTQGAFPAREQTATILNRPLSTIKMVPMEIGGGFGGKIPVYLEPLAVLLSEKSGCPVKMGMTRADVFQCTGPASSTVAKVRMGATKDGTLVAAEVEMAYEAGAFPGQWGAMGANCAMACYKVPNMRVSVYDVLTNTSKVAAYRAPSSPQAMFGVESVMDQLAQKLGIDPLEMRLKNAVAQGDPRPDGLVYPRIGLRETIQKAMDSEHYRAPVPAKPNQSRGIALGCWHNAGMQSSAQVFINTDGTASVVTGSVDIGGSRTSMAMMAAEALGIRAEEVRPSVADTDSIGYTDVTGGSRTTYATGYAVWEACQDAIEQMRVRVATLWDVKTEKVVYQNGAFQHPNQAEKPMSVKALASKLPHTGGPVVGRASLNTNKGVGASFGCHIADVDVDIETGKVKILRYTVVQDVGTAIHPSYVEGQMMGGALQGIGWALNEEYCYDQKGEMQNPGFLDYRMPTFLDAPNMETILVEVPNPGHPYGVRGVGETPIVPPMGALHNAIARAVGVRVNSLPMSPPKLQAAIQAAASPPTMAAAD